MTIKCLICRRPILSHACYIQCSVCHLFSHIQCLPQISTADPIYIDRNTNDWICTICIEDALPFNNLIDDDEFLASIAPDRLQTHQHSIKELNQLTVYNPFELCDDKLTDPLQDIDPDTQFYKLIPNLHNNSDYYFETSFKTKCASLGISSKNFSCVHFNARSLPKHFTEIESYLCCLDIDFSVIGISETWLKPHTADLYDIQGYSHASHFREMQPGGGVSLFVREDL